MSYIKEFLKDVYTRFGYSKSPVATDIGEYFNIKEVLVNIPLGNGKYKRERGFEILSKK